MRFIIYFIFLIYSCSVFANRISIEIDPVRPVLNEPFRAIVTIETTESERPSFSFNPIGVEVLDRREEGISTQTTIINGQISMRRIYQIVYSLNAKTVGNARLTDIRAAVGNRTILADPITIQIVRERAAPRMFFVRAEPTKQEIYIGEGINVEYYLYFRVPVVNLEILDFPKLNGFIKRFHMTNDHHETVEVEGTLYRRRKAYSARVYPERIGELSVDPIRLNVHYSDQAGGSMSAFGFGARQQTRSIFSENIFINVLPLPTEGLPRDFTGLVGDHTFKLELRRNRFLRNEVVEIKLEVDGEGALENFSPPTILNNPAFERFDVKQDFREINPSIAKKIFQYTFIAREATKLPKGIISLSYFLPGENRYKTVELEIPEIVIADNDDVGSASPLIPSRSMIEDGVSSDRKLMAPLFSSSQKRPSLFLGHINQAIYLALMLLILLWLQFLYSRRVLRLDDHYKKIVREIKQNGANYHRLFSLFDFCIGVGRTGQDLRDCIQNANLSLNAKQYFEKLLNSVESSEFVRDQKMYNLKFERSYYDELYKIRLKRLKDEQS
jgi:hypothetical protein